MDEDRAAAGTQACPFCGEALPAVPSRTCPACDSDITEIHAEEIAGETAAGTRADAEAGKFRGIPADAFRRFRTGTIVAAVFLAVGVILVVAAAVLPRTAGSEAVLCGVVGGTTLTISLICTLAMGIPDLLLPGPDRIIVPEAALRAYATSLVHKRWEYAWHLVVPRGREGVRTRPAMEKLKLEGAEVDLCSVEDLEDFWRPVLHSFGGMVRTTKAGRVAAVMDGPDRAVASCTLTVTSWPRWIYLTILISLLITVVCYYVTRKTEVISLDLPLIEVDGRWYLLDAVPPLAED